MKKKVAKLQLHKETLRSLGENPEKLREVVGGGTVNTCTTPWPYNSCVWCPEP